MAKGLASRAHSDEALQERLERAAARFSSIHARWAGVTTDASLAAPAVLDAQAETAASGRDGHGDLALPIAESGVCVTPILGIAAVSNDEPRPRFKTLMGVPRDELDGDDGSASEMPAPDAGPQRASPGSDAASDAARSKRPTPPPLPEKFLALPEAAPLPSRASSEASTGAEPARDTLPPQTVRTAPQQELMHALGTPDIAADAASFRRGQRRRSWLVGMGSFAATLAVFAIAAPRERALAARWMQDEFQARVQPSLRVVTDSVRALKPSVVEPGPARPGLVERPERAGASAEMRPIEEPPLLGPADLRPAPAVGNAAPTAPAMEVVSKPASETAPASGPLPSSNKPPGALGPAQPNTDALVDSSASPPAAPELEVMDSAQAKSQVAAPRKRSTRAAVKGRATTAEIKLRAARTTKARAARQNSPRRAGNGGIIRETPF